MKAAWVLVLFAAACGGKDDSAGGGDTTAKPTEKPAVSEAKQSLVDAWKKAGLTPGELAPAEKGFGKDCNSTTVNKVEVVVCEFGNADEAKKAEAPGLEWVGTTTGAAWSAGPLVIAVADRKKADAGGKTINQLMKSTPK
jgi:hypothetical protein